MQLAEQGINDAGGVAGREIRLEFSDDHGDPAETEALLLEALSADPPAVLVVGPGSAVTSARPAIEEHRTPVLLLEGDLYSSRSLFRYAFQTTVPLRWQARVIARYLVSDRGHDRVALVTEAGPEGETATEAFDEAMAEEGSAPATTVSVRPGGPGRTFAGISPLRSQPVLNAAEDADAVAFFGSVVTAAAVSKALGHLEDQPQLAVSSDGLQPSFAAQRALPGTVTCYPYTWSGWADMIPRVGAFRERFSDAFAHVPAGLEQEGYDSVRALAEALERTGGRGGDALVGALEAFREETYSSIPIRLGPDDHVLAEQSQLGLFAVDEVVPPPGEASSLIEWRPIMRTFTTDGQKVNLLDRDKRVFFPFWRPKRPSPKYWRSRYGIVTRPDQDPLL